jgi:hypothetical protein
MKGLLGFLIFLLLFAAFLVIVDARFNDTPHESFEECGLGC